MSDLSKLMLQPLDAGLAQAQMQRNAQRLVSAARLEAKLQPGQAVSASDRSLAEQQKAATQFEGMLLQEMLKAMWQTVPTGGLISGSREEELYRDMLNEALSESISEGQGIGIKDVVLKEFQRRSQK